MTPKQQAYDLLAGYFGDTSGVPGVPLGLVDRISDIIQANRLSNDMFGDANTERQKGVERIAELEGQVRNFTKYANCGGTPTGRTCSVDKHEIYGPFVTDEVGAATCEFHAYRSRIAELEAALAREQNGRKETLHTLDGLTEKLAETRREVERQAKMERVVCRTAELSPLVIACLLTTNAQVDRIDLAKQVGELCLSAEALAGCDRHRVGANMAGGAMTDERRQAIDKLAEEVMGWSGMLWDIHGNPEWNPFENWADAGMLVEKAGIQLEPTDTGHWRAIARVDEWHMKKWVRAKSPTEAIALAALAAVKAGS